MSNTSYSFKENSHMKDIQGGEKKVMKKILSVALSTAMAFSMFASVAFSADAKLTPQQQFDALKAAGIVAGYPDGTAGLDKTITRAELATIIVKAIDLDPIPGVATYKDKNYSVNHWAAKYIEAATEAGILTGKDAVKQLFGPNDNLTVQELAVVLVKALKLEVPAETNNTATEWAKGYVQAAIDKGLIESGINYQANATRSQVVVAAHAIYEANQVPTVASYTVSEAGKVVEFKLSNDEVVKVTLDEALVPNKETEVKFTHNGHEYTHKVTYVTTVAQKVDSVKADNLKQVVVTFDGTVDAVTAENADNYVVKDRDVDSVVLSDDKTTATITLKGDTGNFMVNQKETELEIKNVQNEDGTKTFNDKVKFTPSDVTAPTVQEVTGLGTKAFKIKFSEPINAASITTSSKVKVDGKAIAASVRYAFPDTVIVQTDLAVGEHTVTVSDVEDFSGLKVAPVSNEFTIVEDTEAPQVVSAKTKDLYQATIEFNETIKDVGDVYANTTSNKATVTYKDNKIVLDFEKPLNYSENTITIKAARDYSNNSADREVKVTPTLDTTRPTVTEVKFEENAQGRFVAKIKFSEELKVTTAEDSENYVLKNNEGKIADVDGVNKDGHPLITPKYADRVVTIDFGPGLKDEVYTLTISGVQDRAAVGNVIIPVTVDLDASSAQHGDLSRVWKENGYVFLEFNKTLATSGAGNAYDPDKYALVVKDKATGNVVKTYKLTDETNDIDLISASSVRISTKALAVAESEHDSDTHSFWITASYIANADNKYLTQAGSYTLEKQISDGYVRVDGDVEATSTSEVKVKFDSRINSFYASDFYLANSSDGGRKYPTSATLSSDGKTLTLKFKDSNEVASDVSGLYLRTVSQQQIRTQDNYGSKIKEVGSTEKLVVDKIRPEIVNKTAFEVGAPYTVTDTTYVDITLTITENVKFNAGEYGSRENVAVGLFKVKFGTNEAVVDSVGYDDNKITLKVKLEKSNGEKIVNPEFVNISFSADNDTKKAIIDENGNALKSIEVSRALR